VNWVEALVDPMTEYAVPAVVASGRTGKVRISTFNGTPFALKYVQNGKIVTMDIAENLDWKGWAGLDQTMRVMLGETPIAKDITPVRVFNTSNVSEAGNPPSYNTGVGAAYINGFLKMWNVG
jgi:ribose transport system substrate-binding protein